MADQHQKNVDVRRIRLTNADDHTKTGCAFIVSGRDRLHTGIRTVQLAVEGAGIKGLPAQEFDSIVSLYDTPGKSSLFPYDNVTDLDVLKRLDVAVNDRGVGTAQVNKDHLFGCLPLLPLT